MGGLSYLLGADLTEHWETVGVVEAGGNRVKLLEYERNGSNKLPEYSGQTHIYAKPNQEGRVTQMRIYGPDRRTVADIDWSHGHKGLKNGVVHIHYSEDGTLKHREKPRYMNREEIKQYGNIIRELDPAAKLLPGRGKG